MEEPTAEKDAGHDARCEREYTESGFIFIDCLCSLRRAQAEAWDWGYHVGLDHGRGGARLVDERGEDVDYNPYRVTSPAECNGMCVMDESGYAVEHPHPGCPAHATRVTPPAEPSASTWVAVPGLPGYHPPDTCPTPPGES